MKWDKSIFISLFVFLIVLTSSFYGFSKMSTSSKDLERVRESVQEGILECYSVEGVYPKDIDYLSKEYGIYINKDQYQVHYRYLGSNIMPEYKIFLKGDRYE